MLTLREAEERFGLKHWHVYAAAKRGELHCIQREGRGRKYYPEWELVRLAASIGLYSEYSAA